MLISKIELVEYINDQIKKVNAEIIHPNVIVYLLKNSLASLIAT